MNLAERIDDFLEERANAEIDWDDQVSAFRDFVEMELQEQREACADAATTELDTYFGKSVHRKMLNLRVSDACLNAVEKSDE